MRQWLCLAMLLMMGRLMRTTEDEPKNLAARGFFLPGIFAPDEIRFGPFVVSILREVYKTQQNNTPVEIAQPMGDGVFRVACGESAG